VYINQLMIIETEARRPLIIAINIEKAMFQMETKVGCIRKASSKE